jgi:hypothetical protein
MTLGLLEEPVDHAKVVMEIGIEGGAEGIYGLSVSGRWRRLQKTPSAGTMLLTCETVEYPDSFAGPESPSCQGRPVVEDGTLHQQTLVLVCLDV